jgi:hypothetical protein
MVKVAKKVNIDKYFETDGVCRSVPQVKCANNHRMIYILRASLDLKFREVRVQVDL